jgi:hypothetical protein
MYSVAGEARTIEGRLSKGDWIVGDAVSAVDLYIYPCIHLLHRALMRPEAQELSARFLPLETTGATHDSRDGQNVIVFRDTPEMRSVVGWALAVTLNMVQDDGRIIDSDMLFNPAYTYSTTLAPDTYDVQSLVTHELGHALGANHSTILAARLQSYQQFLSEL